MILFLHRRPSVPGALTRAGCGVSWLLIAVTCALLWLAHDPVAHAWLHDHAPAHSHSHGHDACCPHDLPPSPAPCEDSACAIQLFAAGGVLLVAAFAFALVAPRPVVRLRLAPTAPLFASPPARHAPACGPPRLA